ncbi:hypothetical protein [Pontimicrobium sp. MEBiC01747]
MNNHFHFNALPESAICIPELSSSSKLSIIIPLNTKKYEATLHVFKRTEDNPKILNLYYYIRYEVNPDLINTSIKFLSIVMDNLDLKDFKLIRHKTILVNSSSDMGTNLDNVPFGDRTINQRPEEVPVNNNEGYTSDLLSPYHVLEGFISNNRTVDSCTIPPTGGGE